MPDLTLIYLYVCVTLITARLYLIKIVYKYQSVFHVLVLQVSKHGGNSYRPDGLTRNVLLTLVWFHCVL